MLSAWLTVSLLRVPPRVPVPQRAVGAGGEQRACADQRRRQVRLQQADDGQPEPVGGRAVVHPQGEERPGQRLHRLLLHRHQQQGHQSRNYHAFW